MATTKRKKLLNNRRSNYTKEEEDELLVYGYLRLDVIKLNIILPKLKKSKKYVLLFIVFKYQNLNGMKNILAIH